MKNMGVSFEIPNKNGKYLSDILEPIPFGEYQWLIDNDEIHLLENNEFTNEFLFKEEDIIISGEKLYNTAKTNNYYMIFVTLRAFFKNGDVQPVSSYKEFLESDCEIVLEVDDCSYVMFWCKNKQLILNMYNYALSKGYKNIEYISEKDLIEKKYIINR
jgi:hypothetical protein